ncbi:hypothetical protein BH09ACT12_BH09ACT12_00280 [soil metagenome]
MHLRRVTTSLAALSLLCATAACGDDEPEADDTTDGAGMSGMVMNDPEATPADEVDGDVATGTFSVLDTAPPGSEGVAGQAWLAQNDDGTTVTIRLTGLVPDTAYVSHLHAQTCADDDGGPHFTFDPAGGDDPPNEVHLAFTSTEDGVGEATITNDGQVGDRAPAIVVHPADAMDNRLACADFS